MHFLSCVWLLSLYAYHLYTFLDLYITKFEYCVKSCSANSEDSHSVALTCAQGTWLLEKNLLIGEK